MPVKTYYLVRHAEKQNPADPNSPISAAGQTRAVALKDLLKTKGITTIIVSEFLRTQQTAKPLEDAIHVQHVMLNHSNIQAIVQCLDQSGNSLLVGHTDNIPEIVKKLTGDTVSIAENDFDNLFIITVTQVLFFKFKKLQRTVYGLASP